MTEGEIHGEKGKESQEDKKSSEIHDEEEVCLSKKGKEG
jgi:hypothetical protein